MIRNTLLLREKLIGRSLMECHNQASREKIQQVVDWFIAEDNHNIVYNFLALGFSLIKVCKPIWEDITQGKV